MDHVGLAGAAGLQFVVFGGEAAGVPERGEILSGTKFVDLGLKLAVKVFHEWRNADRLRFGRSCLSRVGWHGEEHGRRQRRPSVSIISD
jgi:hypothetical protein